MKRKIEYIAVPSVIALVILYLCCFLPPNDIPEVESTIPVDKLVHFAMYFGFSGACFFAYIHLVRLFNYLMALFLCFVLPVLFGGLIEILQWKYCPGRSGDWFDLLADTLGALTVIPFALYYKKVHQKKYKK